MIQHVLRISCKDRNGLIHEISGILLKYGLNIVENIEHVDRHSGWFHMRTQVTGAFEPAKVLSEIRTVVPEQSAFLALAPLTRKRLVIYATKEPHCLGDLLLRHASGELNADIVAVVSQYEVLRKLVGRFEIPFHFVPVQSGDRAAHEHALLEVTLPPKPDYLVLAKYMRVLSAEFVSQFPGRAINIHHSFLPAFSGKNPYLQAHERGVKIIGATAHFVNEHLDDGPIITQSVLPVNHTHSPEAMALAGRDIERTVLARALKLVLEDRVLVQGNRTLVFE